MWVYGYMEASSRDKRDEEGGKRQISKTYRPQDHTKECGFIGKEKR